MNVLRAHGILLAAVMEADRMVKPIEFETGRRLLYRQRVETGQRPICDWQPSIDESELVHFAVNILRKQPKPFREKVVADLWDMSQADGEVHAAEDRLIRQVAAWLKVDASPQGGGELRISTS